MIFTNIKDIPWHELNKNKDLVDFIQWYKTENNLVWAKNRYNGQITVVKRKALKDTMVSDALTEIEESSIEANNLINLECIIDDYIQLKVRKLIKETSQETGLKIMLR